MSNGAPPNPALEAYKLEYQLAASRYENIYTAIWQIFSYLAAVTGAILTFGGDRFHQNLLWVLASLPLFFWYLSTYLPLDRYGHHCLDRLAGIENDIKGLSGATLKHYSDFKESRSKTFWSKLRRAQVAVHVFCIALGLMLAVNGYKTYRAWCHDEPLIIRKTVETRPICLTVDELKKLLQQSSPASQPPQEVKPSDHDGAKKK